MPTATLPKVLFLNHPTSADPAYVKHIEAQVELTVIEQKPRNEQIDLIKKAVAEKGPFEAFIIFLNFGEPNCFPFNEDVLGPLLPGCRLVSHPGAGYDRVDTQLLTAANCFYANNPSSVGMRTADSTACMILQALRGSGEHDRNVREGKWVDRKLLSKDARSSTLGIVGMGNIGSMVAAHMQHFGMKVVYTKRSRLPLTEENGARYVTLAELLKESDVVCLNCPLTEETLHIIGADEIAQMKDNVIIVNTARGPCIDEQALVDALDSGKVLRAALDVFEFEPKVHPGLVASRKTILSPHNAVLNETLRKDQEEEMLANLESYLKTGKPNTPVNLA